MGVSSPTGRDRQQGAIAMTRSIFDSPQNIAARMGNWSAAHRKTAIFGWLAFVVAAIVIGSAVGQRSIDQQDTNVGQAHKGDEILKSAGFTQSGRLTEIVVVQGKTKTVADPAFRAAVESVVHAVAPFGAVQHLRSPLTAADQGQVSPDGHTALVEWDMAGPVEKAEKHIDPLTATIASSARANPDFYIGEAGSVSTEKALNNLFSEQLEQAGTRSVPLTLLILVLVFGSVLAAFVPLMLGLQAVIATIGLTAIFSHVLPMDESVSAIVTLVGLAVGVDYTLFYLRREREERAAGREEGASLAAAAATSGRAVLISGATVIIAMAGMLFTGDPTFQSMGIATMTVVAVAMLGSLTVLPAVLSRLGDKIEKGRLPLLSRWRRPAGESRVWGRILTPVLRRPALSAVLSAGLLLAIAVPTLKMHTAQSGITSLPRSTATVETLDRVQAAFPGQAMPAVVAVKTDTDAPAFKSAIAQLRDDA